MYDGVVISVRISGRITNEFPITIGFHQESTLSPYLFALVMDELTKPTQEEVSWCTLFEDHIVLVDGTRSGVKFKLEIWQENVE